MYRLMIGLLLLTACGTRQDIDLKQHRIENFSLERYLGSWYETERIDNKFERGLSQVTAQYYIDENKRIRVVNRGYSDEKKRYKEAKGYIKETETPGILKVSFFRPFYSSYVVLDIDREYRYALVGGGSSEYLWILSRTGEIPEGIRKEFIEKAGNMGYKTEKLRRY